MTRREALDEYFEQHGTQAMVADGFDDAIIGVTLRSPAEGPRVVYDVDLCVEALQADGIPDYDDASEYFDFNVIGAWVGETTPLFIRDIQEIDAWAGVDGPRRFDGFWKTDVDKTREDLGAWVRR